MHITNPNIRDYVMSVMPERPERLEALHQEAMRTDIPIIKHEMEQFLSLMVKLHKPKRILEVGTAIGYSSIIMSMASDEPLEIVTLEKSPSMIEKAKKNLVEFGFADRVRVIAGDAEENLDVVEGLFDMVFIDAAKGQYMIYYEKCLPKLKVGGLLIADNILQDGLVAKSRFAIPRRQRTIHNRMRTFIKTVSDNKNLQTTVLPIADGATISLKLRNEGSNEY